MIRKAPKGSEVLLKLLKQTAEIKNEKRKNAAKNIPKMIEKTTKTFEKIKLDHSEKEISEKDLEGTVCYYGSVCENSSVKSTVVKQTDCSEEQPDFMQFFDEEDKKEKANHYDNLLVAVDDPLEKEIHEFIKNGYTERDLANLPQEKVREMLKRMDTLMQKNMQHIKEKYDKRRQPIQAALQKIKNFPADAKGFVLEKSFKKLLF